MIAWIISFFAPVTNYWQAIVTFILTAIVAFALHTLDVAGIRASQKTALEQQATDLEARCTQQKQITSEVDNAFQKNISSNGIDYDRAIGLLNNQNCGLPATGSPGGNHAAAHDNRLYYTDVRAAYATLQRQKVASDQAAQLLGCQNYINAIQKNLTK